jgi:HEPN domain-containing protein
LRGEARRWLEEALWDIETARILYREKRYNAVAFYAQQAGLMAAKALLYHVNENPWGRSVRVLLERFYERMGAEPDEKLLTYARELDRHYIPSRYPNAHPAGTPHEAYDAETAERALEAAEAIIMYARRVIEGEG